MTLIGLNPGTVTSFALHHDVGQKIEVVVDRQVDQSDTIGIHPNVNTTTLVISYQDFTRLLTWAKHPPIYTNM